MKKIIFCIVILFNLPAWAVDYNDFPPALQQILDQRNTELSSKGGVCVAGSVITNNDVYFGSGKELQVNFLQGSDDAPLYIYDGGWFIMEHTSPANSKYGPAKLILRAFGYDPIDASIAASEGKITYAEFVMNKTTPKDLVTITGIVTDDKDKPLGGVSVNLKFKQGYSETNGYPLISATTEPNGRYSFENLSATEYRLYIDATSGYAGVSCGYITPAKGKTTIRDIKLYPNLLIVIDYVY